MIASNKPVAELRELVAYELKSTRFIVSAHIEPHEDYGSAIFINAHGQYDCVAFDRLIQNILTSSSGFLMDAQSDQTICVQGSVFEGQADIVISPALFQG